VRSSARIGSSRRQSILKKIDRLDAVRQGLGFLTSAAVLLGGTSTDALKAFEKRERVCVTEFGGNLGQRLITGFVQLHRALHPQSH
jgi:hypothetical protein